MEITGTALELLASLVCSALVMEPSIEFSDTSVTVNGGIEHLEVIVACAIGLALTAMPSHARLDRAPLAELASGALGGRPGEIEEVSSPAAKYH